MGFFNVYIFIIEEKLNYVFYFCFLVQQMSYYFSDIGYRSSVISIIITGSEKAISIYPRS